MVITRSPNHSDRIIPLDSLTIPRLIVKLDATPGRLNPTSFLIYRVGLFYGQCSEICGVNHSFIPILIEKKVNTIKAKLIS